MNTDELFGLTGKVAMVIGGGQGMGERSSIRLAEAGCDVAVVDLELARAEAVAAKVRALGRRAVGIAANILDDSQAPALVANVEKALGAPDVLVTIVGQANWKSLLDMNGADWDLDMNRNLRYIFIHAREVAESMVLHKKGGSMVFISSVSGLQSAPMHASYGAAKFGLVNLVRTMACEWSQFGIRANAIAPGQIYTPRIPRTPERQAAIEQSLVPMKRRGETDEIGKAVLFLASEMASYVTGTTLPVDGGWMSASTVVRPADMKAA